MRGSAVKCRRALELMTAVAAAVSIPRQSRGDREPLKAAVAAGHEPVALLHRKFIPPKQPVSAPPARAVMKRASIAPCSCARFAAISLSTLESCTVGT
jgi:hypothetical protein